MKIILLTTLILTLGFSNSIAQKKLNHKPVIERIDWLKFLTIDISHYVERYEREEINVIYHYESVLKIHSIPKSNSFNEKQIDTVFTLNEKQLNKLDKFLVNFDNKSVPTGIIFGGTYTAFTVKLNSQIKSFKSKSSYSLILDLIAE